MNIQKTDSLCPETSDLHLGTAADQVCAESIHAGTPAACSKSISAKALMAAGLFALGQASCLLDSTGSCPEPCNAQGGTGGTNVSSSSSGGSGGSENVGGMGGSTSSSSGGTGGMNEGGAGGMGGTSGTGGGNCMDIPVTIEDTTGEYEVKQYDASCVPDGVNTLGGGFETGTTDLCVKVGGGFLVQIKNAADMNSLKFISPDVPSKVEVYQLGVSTPISDSEADAYCSTNGPTLDPVSADQDPTLAGFEYTPSSVGPTNIVHVSY